MLNFFCVLELNLFFKKFDKVTSHMKETLQSFYYNFKLLY